MKISFWDLLTGILLFAGFGVVLVFANIFIDPYTILNPFPPPTIQRTLRVPTLTPTQRELPDIWTITPTGNAQTTTLLPSLTPVATGTGFILPTGTITGTNTPIPSLTPVGPTRTNTPRGGRTNTPTRTRTATASSFTITGVNNISASPSSWTGTCPKTFTMELDISYARDGQMDYYWIRKSNNAHLGGGSYDTDGSSPDNNVHVNLTLGSSGYVGTDTYSFYVDYPNHQKFGSVDIPITCTGLVISANGSNISPLSLSLGENTLTVATLTSNMSGTTTYSIFGGDDAAFFEIVGGNTLSFKSPAPNFEDRQDANTDNTYIVIIQGSNGGFTDNQELRISITDVNEFAPVITSGAAATVAENTPASTTVIDVNATDADGTATITYSISGVDTGDFNINPTTGILTFVSSPNYESPSDDGGNNIYDVTVQASDGMVAHNVTQAIQVTVTNLDETPPVITSDGGAATVNKSVDENDTAVADVDATDAEGTVTFDISGTDSAAFSIVGATGVLTFNPAPDYENPTDAGPNNVYNVTVEVTDGTNTVTQAFIVTVNALNDNNPSITSGTTASTDENTTAVMTVTATDDDDDVGGTITFSITGGAPDGGFFDIDPNSGVLTFASAPDWDTAQDDGGNNIYDVEVTASDDDSNTDSIIIAVTVNDMSD